MAEKIVVKAAHARAQFWQIAPDGSEEHVRAETIDGVQVPVPIEITHTFGVARALMEHLPGSELPARIIKCSEEELADWREAEGDIKRWSAVQEQRKSDEIDRVVGKSKSRKSAA